MRRRGSRRRRVRQVGREMWVGRGRYRGRWRRDGGQGYKRACFELVIGMSKSRKCLTTAVGLRHVISRNMSSARQGFFVHGAMLGIWF